MKLLQLSREYFEEYGKPMLEAEFSEYTDRIAVGLVGHGSECYGFDDEISRDHDYEVGFSLWITEEDDRLFGFKLFRAYDRLPKEYKGIGLQNCSFMGGGCRGVHTISDFYSHYTGCSYDSSEGYMSLVPKSLEQWLYLPDKYLAEAVNGMVFCDPLGEFSKVREVLGQMPEDVKLKKLGSCIFKMAQSGQYNYKRCIDHGEISAATMYLCDFAENAARAVFILNGEYAPYTKWIFKALRNLPILGSIGCDIDLLLKSPADYEANIAIIEKICSLVRTELESRGYSDIRDEYLESHAYRINEKIKSSNIRNLPVVL